MKALFRSAALVLTIICLLSFNYLPIKPLNGAWKLTEGTNEHVLILSDGYLMLSVFDKTGKVLHSSWGGLYAIENNKLNTTVEFDINSKDRIGQKPSFQFLTNGNSLKTDLSGSPATWSKLDDGTGQLAGTWRNSGRMQDGKVVMSPPRARKTFKLLSGTRFQWAAINAETKEFFGTGGGTYTFRDGKYTENIEFFSRDSSRVGASLTFNGKVEEGKHWHHSGLNSKGVELYEIWSKEPVQGH